MWRVKLICKTAVSSDRSLKDLRKERYKQCIFQRIMFRFAAFPVYIQNISGRLKSIKRNSQRKQDLHSPQIHMKQCIQIFNSKIRIFYETKHPKIKDQSQNHKFPRPLMLSCCLLFFYKKSCKPRNNRRKQDEHDKSQTACYVINIAEYQKYQPLPFMRHYVINQYRCHYKQQKQI